MICLFVTFQFAPFVAAAEIDLPRFPAASPDGNFVTFTWRGDLWKGAADGGAATRLTSHPADESRSVWSADGTMIAFESTRDGGRNLYTIDPMGGSLRRVTNTDEILSISSFSTTPTGEPALAAKYDEKIGDHRCFLRAVQFDRLFFFQSRER